jgi:hypothetical protein
MIESRITMAVGRACSTIGSEMNAYKILMAKSEGKRPLGKPRRRWVSNVTMDLIGIRVE